MSTIRLDAAAYLHFPHSWKDPQFVNGIPVDRRTICVFIPYCCHHGVLLCIWVEIIEYNAGVCFFIAHCMQASNRKLLSIRLMCLGFSVWIFPRSSVFLWFYYLHSRVVFNFLKFQMISIFFSPSSCHNQRWINTWLREWLFDIKRDLKKSPPLSRGSK